MPILPIRMPIVWRTASGMPRRAGGLWRRRRAQWRRRSSGCVAMLTESRRLGQARCGDRGTTRRRTPGERGPRRCGRLRRTYSESALAGIAAAGLVALPPQWFDQASRRAARPGGGAPQGHWADPRPPRAGGVGRGCTRPAPRGARREVGGAAGGHRAARERRPGRSILKARRYRRVGAPPTGSQASWPPAPRAGTPP